jgi:hypothetical protein
LGGLAGNRSADTGSCLNWGGGGRTIVQYENRTPQVLPGMLNPRWRECYFPVGSPEKAVTMTDDDEEAARLNNRRPPLQ